MATTIEAVDAIQRALENEGLLQSIRAQLRAGVFNIISKKSGAGRPARSVEALQSREGTQVLELVHEVLEVLHLKETLSVFQAETGMTSTPKRSVLISSHNLHDSDESKPVLQLVLESKRDYPSSASLSKGSSHDSFTGSYIPTVIKTRTLSDYRSDPEDSFEQSDVLPNEPIAAPSSSLRAPPASAVAPKIEPLVSKTLPNLAPLRGATGLGAGSLKPLTSKATYNSDSDSEEDAYPRSASNAKFAEAKDSSPLGSSAVDDSKHQAAEEEEDEIEEEELLSEAESDDGNEFNSGSKSYHAGVSYTQPHEDSPKASSSHGSHGSKFAKDEDDLNSSNSSTGSAEGVSASKRRGKHFENKDKLEVYGAIGASHRVNVRATEAAAAPASPESDRDTATQAIGVQRFSNNSSRSQTGWDKTSEGPEEDDDYDFGNSGEVVADLRSHSSVPHRHANDADDSFEQELPPSQKPLLGSLPSLSGRGAALAAASDAGGSSKRFSDNDTSFQSDIVQMEESDMEEIEEGEGSEDRDSEDDDVLQSSHRSNQEEEEDYLQQNKGKGSQSSGSSGLSWGQRVGKPTAALSSQFNNDEDDVADDALDKSYDQHSDSDAHKSDDDANDSEDDDEEDEDRKPAKASESAPSSQTRSLFSMSTRAAAPEVAPKSSLDNEDVDDYGDDFEQDANEDEKLDDLEDEDIPEEVESDVPEEDDDELSHGDQMSDDSDGFMGEGKSKKAPVSKGPASSSSWAKSDSFGSSLSRSKSGALPEAKTETASTSDTGAKKWSSGKFQDDDDDDDDDYFGDKKAKASEPYKPTSQGKPVASASTTSKFDYKKQEPEDSDHSVLSEDDVEDFSVGEKEDSSGDFSVGKDAGAGAGANKAPKQTDEDFGDSGDADFSVSEFSVSEQEVGSSQGLSGYDYSMTARPPSRTLAKGNGKW